MLAGKGPSTAVPLRNTRRRLQFPGRFAALLLAALMIPACNKSSKGAPPASPSPPPPTLSVVLATPAGIQGGIVPISYTLIDPASLTCTVAVAFSTNGGGSFQPATSGPGGDGATDLVSAPPPGTSRLFAWNSQADGVALGAANPTIRIRITPATSVPGTSSSTANFTVDNSARTAPSITVSTPGGIQGGLVPVSYSLIDAESDVSSLQASFSVNGGASFSPATPGPGGDGIVNLASSAGGGTAHVFLWNSVADGVAPSGVNGTVQVRLVPNDGKAGAPATTSNFSANNAGRSSGSSVGGAYSIQVNGTSRSDWTTAVATVGGSLYALGFEDFDLTSVSGTDSTWHLRKRNAQTGAPVAAFGAGGSVTANPGPGLDLPFRIVADESFLYLLGAQETGLKSGSFVLRIEKRDATNGSLVAAFGAGGILTASAPAGQDGIPLPWTIAVDGSFLYLAGPRALSAVDSAWRIEKRDKSTGSLVAGFGTAGVVDENPTAQVDGCFGIVIDAASLWLVGTEGVDGTAASNGRIRIEKRTLLDGALAAGFGVGGILTVDAGPGDDLAEDGVRDNAFLYVYSRVETASGSGVFQSRLEKRSLGDGSLSQPAVVGTATDPTGALPFPHLVLDGSNLFVCAADGTADCRWLIEKRLLSNLSLVASFGTAGVVTSNAGVGGYDRPLGIAAAGGVLYLVGMDSAASDEQWRIEARWR